tara:strand:+ start:3737 stop:3943 length:207 start_codon:yes stop_codon:yes gene_type:complete
MQAVTGQFGALLLSVYVLYNLMSYHKQVMERMYKDSKEDRDLYRTTLVDLSNRIEKIGDDVREIKAKI